MCGISGIVNRNNQAVVADSIQKMNDSISHRGPDGEGFYFGENFAFGHRRLSILDLSIAGKQPMEFDSDFIITYNGEVYNFIELTTELQLLGYTFKSKTDTEVILAAYKHWGKDCVNHFNGMWSFAIYDKKNEIIFCSRDRFGVKPFYYIESNDFFCFGSEIKQLLPFLENEIKVNKNVLLDFLVLGIEEYTENTFFENVLKLSPGHNLIYNLKDHTYSIEKYYHLKDKIQPNSFNIEKAVDEYQKTFIDAVTLRMRSDVEVGSCLSGGLDSSSIVSISSKILHSESNNNIKAIHAKVNQTEINESPFAEKVAEFCSADLVLVEPTIIDFKENVEAIIKIQEEPFGSPSIVLQYFVLKKAREINCLVLLDGQGGDETLVGYERYYPAYLKQQKGFKRFKDFLKSNQNSRLSKLDLIKYYFYFTKSKLRLRKLKKRHSYLKDSVLNNYQPTVLDEIAKRYLNIEALQLFEISHTQLPHLLKYEDKNSMANSIETRLPFLDYRCVELALSINNQFKIKNGWTKYILRKAIEPFLPKEVVWRKEKLGFNAPENLWLASMKNEMESEIKGSKILNELVDFKSFNFNSLDLRTQWRLYNIAKWEDIFKINY
ncbi:MAG: asparagine synthase (glutamine-hydrolyzing) [Fluviicola sp.]|jgi:asparagine synthase (glutamine-hydrolysing)